MLTKLKNWFRRKETLVTYLVSVMPRAWYEQRSVGGMRITLRFEKTIQRFGRTKKLTATETFNNYHDRQGRFMYNPAYVPDENSHSEDSLWHAMLVWRDCEQYPFATVTTRWLQGIIDDWIKKNNLDCGGEWKR